MKIDNEIKIALIMPVAKRYRYSGKKFARQSCSTLSVLYSLIPENLPIECSVYDESIEEVDFNLIDADIIGISAITPTASRAFAMADSFREKGVYVVIGGVHASLYSEETLLHCDTIITGLAYQSWPQFLIDFSTDAQKKHYRHDVTINLKNLKIDSGECYLKKGKYYFKNSVQATFGCNNKCGFCVQPITSNGNYKRPIDDVVKEIKEIKINFFEFLDPNLSQDKKYLSELCKKIAPLKKQWFSPMTMDIANDDALLNLLELAGCKSVLIGFESINQDTLKSINKYNNIVNKYSDVVKNIHKHGISVIGSFVFGFDGDDISIFNQTLKAIKIIKMESFHRSRRRVLNKERPVPG